MAPQGATRIKKGFPFDCPTGMELGEALRIGPDLFSERPDAPILRRLRRHPPFPKEGGSGSSACTTGVTNVNPVTLSSYSLPSGNTTPSEPFEPFEPSEPGPLRGPFRHHNPQISFLNSQISSHPLNPLFPCVMMEVSFFRGR